jgi:hypothetical protein
MFQLRNKTVELDGIVFTISEPMATDVVDLNKIEVDADKTLFLLSRCVLVDGTPLGDNAARMPARYITPLSEAVSTMAAEGIGEGNG